ncbi:RNA polymerase sigma-70 factor (sigma-E family) [Propionicimonas paludicola]|uniref:RNA polymerase sigma-70 factor (Sigma-E family) n=1 Tax=Propionicimonas paludicola TaxID=185243 RepID=A0A2A9CXP8_9ACTN|nr:SigE family RNA polymerase sigma factor [Propionicimonas paludicola]PFG18442.1 RNA polymerase sigma-70 factor (sigma-E family) [Propionicimonas paludicola]
MGTERVSRREQEFAEFFAAASPYLARTAYLLSGDREVAKELTQEALARTYAVWWRLRPEDARGYARRVLVNLNVDRWRQRGPQAVELADYATSGSAESAYDDRDEVARLLRTLSPQQRQVIVLRYFDDLSEAEVARSLGVSAGTVKAACSRGLANLRRTTAAAKEGER